LAISFTSFYTEDESSGVLEKSKTACMKTQISYSQVGCRSLLEKFGSFYAVKRKLYLENKEGNYTLTHTHTHTHRYIYGKDSQPKIEAESFCTSSVTTVKTARCKTPEGQTLWINGISVFGSCLTRKLPSKEGCLNNVSLMNVNRSSDGVFEGQNINNIGKLTHIYAAHVAKGQI
jgi:hypothetical protein